MRWGSTASAMAMEMAVWCGLGWLGDRQWGTHPWLLMTGACVGMLAFGWRVKRLLDEIQRGTPDK
jgi:F0F1-type ATP synthase assembly protein I